MLNSSLERNYNLIKREMHLHVAYKKCSMSPKNANKLNIK